MKHDIIIIGSGLGGLECAVMLAKAGKDVLVVEREMQPGGCLQSYRRRGADYDTGFHYVGGLAPGQSLHQAFSMLGLTTLPWHHLDADAFDRVTIDGRTYSFAEGYDAFARQMADYFPGERQGLNNYVDMLRRSSDEQLASLSGSPSALNTKMLEIGAYSYLRSTLHDERLCQVVAGTSLKMELRRESLPLFTFAHGNSGYIESSWRLKGSGNDIVNRLIEELRAAGGDIVCRKEVVELIEHDGKLTAARFADGDVMEADMFISDAHPAVTMYWLRGSHVVRKAFRRRMAMAENTFGMFTTQLRLKPGTLRYFNHNKFIYRHANVWDFYLNTHGVDGVMVSCRVPDDGTEWASQIDLLTPMSWQQCQQWAGTTVGHRGADYEQLKKAEADQCIALAETAIPGLRDSIDAVYTSSPLTYHDYTLTPEGSAYGMRKDYHNALMTLLSPRTPLPNLLLTGQSLMLHGLHGVTMTALFTASEVVGSDYIMEQLRQQ